MRRFEIVSKGVSYSVVVDVENCDRVLLAGPWRIHRDKQRNYVKRSVRRAGKRTTQFLHQFIAGFVGIDHVNGDPLDNRKANLRAATPAQNNQNLALAKNNTSGYRGVSWHARDRKWLARVQVDGKLIHIGRFDDLELAAREVRAARIGLMPYSKEE